jgi:hypothetical protein
VYQPKRLLALKPMTMSQLGAYLSVKFMHFSRRVAWGSEQTSQEASVASCLEHRIDCLQWWAAWIKQAVTGSPNPWLRLEETCLALGPMFTGDAM